MLYVHNHADAGPHIQRCLPIGSLGYPQMSRAFRSGEESGITEHRAWRSSCSLSSETSTFALYSRFPYNAIASKRIVHLPSVCMHMRDPHTRIILLCEQLILLDEVFRPRSHTYLVLFSLCFHACARGIIPADRLGASE